MTSNTKIRSFMLMRYIFDYPNLQKAEKFLCLVIAGHWSPGHQTFVSSKTLAKITRYSERHIKRLKQSLHEKGVLELINDKNPDTNNNEVTRFRFDVSKVYRYWQKRYSTNPHVGLDYEGGSDTRVTRVVNSSSPGVVTPMSPKEESIKKKTKNYTDDFLAFYEIYPRKVAKYKAFTIWSKMAAEDRKLALDAIKVQASEVFADREEKYIPHPSVWLKQRRWEDQVKPKPRPPGEATRSSWDDLRR